VRAREARAAGREAWSMIRLVFFMGFLTWLFTIHDVLCIEQAG
jgi:hypothetical protein